MSVAFPAGYALTKETSIEVLTNTVFDRMDDGALRSRVLGADLHEEISCVIPYVTQSEYITFREFVKTNRGVDITITLDGTNYIGQITSGLTVRRRGSYFRISFTYYAKEV